MKVLSKILWAVDIANHNTISVAKIRTLTRQFGNEIILLYVLPNQLKKRKGLKKVEEAYSLEMIQKVVMNLNLEAEHPVKVRIEFGSIADRINEVAIEEDVNLVLLNKGKTDNIGDNGLNALRKIQKPVAVLSEKEFGDNNHIVCPVDHSKESAVTLRSAMLHARKFNSKLSVISVFEPESYTSPRLMRMGLDAVSENNFHMQNFKKEFNRFLMDFDFSGIDVEAIVLSGNPDKEIINFCKNASLLYVGSAGKSFIQRAFRGSVSENVIRNVDCNIVSVKNESVFKLRIIDGPADVERYLARGNEMRKLGYVKEAIAQYKAGLKLNSGHLPIIKALSETYALMDDRNLSESYKIMSQDIMINMMNRKIEAEIRRNYRTVI